MSVQSDENISISCQDAKCNTCKALFSSIEKAKEHYKSDWHIYNSKRRANNLLPLSKQDYKKAIPLIQEKQKKPTNISPKAGGILHQIKTIITSESDEAKEDKDSHLNEDEEVDDKDLYKGSLDGNVSLFDNKVFETVDECVEYMAMTFGFFIPDIEYLMDRDGLLMYLNEKIKIGNVCLYCQKQLKTYRSCQNHMLTVSHCKIAYEEGVDSEEFEDFYDFSESNTSECIADEYDDDGNVIEKTLEISAIGELILTDGKTVGHRAFRRYYKQKFRPDENRPSVVAAQREELLRLSSKQFGGQRLVLDDLQELNDTQVMALLVQQQKAVRHHQMIEQRAQQRRDFIDQRREYKSTVDKLRSSATTTAKIRDYHSRLV